MKKEECRMKNAGLRVVAGVGLVVMLIAVQVGGQEASSWGLQFLRRADAARAREFLGLTNLTAAAEIEAQLTSSNYVTGMQLGSSNFVTATQVGSQIGSSNFVTAIQAGAQIGSSNFVTAAQLGSSNYLTANQTITLSGDTRGTGSAGITTTTTNIQPPIAGSSGQPLVRIGSGVGFTNIPASSVTGLADAQTNALLLSFRSASIVSNGISIAANATNSLGWVTNLAGLEFSYPAVGVTNLGNWQTNAPLLLFSTDGTNYWPGTANLCTNVPVLISWYSGSMVGSMGSNSLTYIVQIATPGIVTNITAYSLTRPDLFGRTNSAYGEHLVASDPVWPSEVATKSYVDNLILFTPWWSAQNEIQVNGFAVNLSSTWKFTTDALTNSSSYHLSFLGSDLITATAPPPQLLTNLTVSVTSSNVTAKIPTNGLAVAPRLEISHYITPTAWYWMTNVASVVNTNYSWTFTRPYADQAFLIAAAPSASPAAVVIGGVLDLTPFSAVTTNLGALRIWNSNNAGLWARGTNGVDKLLVNW